MNVFRICVDKGRENALRAHSFKNERETRRGKKTTSSTTFNSFSISFYFELFFLFKGVDKGGGRWREESVEV